MLVNSWIDYWHFLFFKALDVKQIHMLMICIKNMVYYISHKLVSCLLYLPNW